MFFLLSSPIANLASYTSSLIFTFFLQNQHSTWNNMLKKIFYIHLMQKRITCVYIKSKLCTNFSLISEAKRNRIGQTKETALDKQNTDRGIITGFCCVHTSILPLCNTPNQIPAWIFLTDMIAYLHIMRSWLTADH
jgi:hypothetical protein